MTGLKHDDGMPGTGPRDESAVVRPGQFMHIAACTPIFSVPDALKFIHSVEKGK
jgi:hypothetical protein